MVIVTSVLILYGVTLAGILWTLIRLGHKLDHILLFLDDDLPIAHLGHAPSPMDYRIRATYPYDDLHPSGDAGDRARAG